MPSRLRSIGALLLLTLSVNSLAATSVAPPVAPKPIPQSAPVNAFHCQRFFVYRGKALPCDSLLAQDGEGLRQVVQGVPAAVEELDIYEANRSRQRLLAYLGTAGALVGIFGFFLSRKHQYADESLDPTGKALRTAGIIGLGTFGLSLGIGLSTLSSNEKHIDNAIRFHNEARPNDPIQLQFSVALP